MAADDARGTVPLSDLEDFRVADGAPDVRGWSVKTEDGGRVGEVTELLVSPAARRVRYLCVKLDRGVAGDATREVLVPVGVARLDDRRDDVLLPASAIGAFEGLADYAGGTPPRDYESSLRNRLARSTGTHGAGTDFYAHDHFDEDRFYGARHPLRDAAERRLVRTEEVVVERRIVADAPVAGRRTARSGRPQREAMDADRRC